MAQWPTFTWDARARQYRDSAGRFVPRTAVRQALDESIKRAKAKITRDARLLQAGAINLPEWQLRTEANLKTIHVMSAAVAAGGWAQATSADWSRAGSRLAKQYRFLERFARQIESGAQPLDGRFLVRAESYATAGSGTYEAVLRRIDLASGLVTEERRVLHSANPCTSCLGYHALGWQPPGTLPDIGEDCECGMRCQCSFQRRASKGEGRKRPPPAFGGPGPAPVPIAARPAAFALPVPAPAVAPLPERPAAVAATPTAPVLPGRPIAERIAGWDEGRERIRQLQAIGSDYARLRQEKDARRAELESAITDHKELKAGPEKRAALAARKVAEAAFDRAHVAFLREERAVREKAQEVLAAPGRMHVGLYPSAAEKLTSHQLDSVGEGMRWMQRNMVHPEGATDTLRVNAIPIPTGLAQRSACGPAFMWVAQDVGPATVVHEMGHHFDYQVEGFKEASTAFLEHRVGDEPLRPFNEVMGDRGKFDKDEVGRKDRFDDAFDEGAWYVGKHYEDGSTEITAMGLEMMFRDPVGFAQADPEFAAFILGLMHGTLR